MFRREVYKVLYEGKDVRHATWAEGRYIRLDSKGAVRDQDGILYNLNANEFYKEDGGWEIYKPKQIVKKKMYIYEDTGGVLRVDRIYNRDFPHGKVSIEVEVE